MQQETTISPSAGARSLFGQMIARAEESDNNLTHLSLVKTLELSVDRKKAGNLDTQEVHELRNEDWITPAPDGGWFLLSS